MIKKQIIKEDNKPVAVVLDYQEYLKLEEYREDVIDYQEAVEIKRTNKKWVDHDNLKKDLGM
jgi:Ethanolamine utilization protein EutJ (predicted chaperonin)